MHFFFVVDDHSINMLQYEITVCDRARLKLTPALFSLKKQKQNKKTPRCSLCLSPPFLFLWLCVFECVCE